MEQLFKSLPEVLQAVGRAPATDEALVFAAWRRCAGEALGSRTTPQQFFEKRLVISVADETWRRHLEDLSPQMIARLNALLGDGTVRFIEFRIDPRPATARIETAEDQPLTADPMLTSAAAAITDEQLRQRFLEAAASCLSKKEHGR
jgi:hypothetical protein